MEELELTVKAHRSRVVSSKQDNPEFPGLGIHDQFELWLTQYKMPDETRIGQISCHCSTISAV